MLSAEAEGYSISFNNCLLLLCCCEDVKSHRSGGDTLIELALYFNNSFTILK